MTPFEFPIQIRFGDVDAFGHVNNAVHLSYLENAREALYRECGLAPLIEGCFLLVAHQHIEYLAPLEFRENPVITQVWASRLGRSSVDLNYTTVDEPGGTVFARARTGMVLASRESGRPQALSDRARETLQPWVGAAVSMRSMGAPDAA